MTKSAPPSRALRLGWNMIYHVIGQISIVPISFIVIPWIVHGLGDQGYALYGLFGLITGHIYLLNFGAGTATVKYVAESVGDGDKNKLAATLRSSFWMHTAPIAAGSVIVWFGSELLITGIFDVDPKWLGRGIWTVRAAAVSALFYSWTQFSVAVFQGLQQLGRVNIILFFQSFLLLVGSAALIYFGFDLLDIATLYIGLNAAISMATWLVRRKELEPRLIGADDSISNRPADFYSFGGYAFLGQLAWSATFQWDKFLIGAFLPLSELTYYLIPAFILHKFWILPASVAATTFPLISELAGEGNKDSLKKVYRQCGQLILWFIVPTFTVLALFAPQLLTLWLGTEFSDKGTWPLRFLVLGYLFNFIATMPSTAATGIGRPKYSFYWQLAQATLCIASWSFLIPRHGIEGAARGFAAAQMVAGLGFILLKSREILDMSFFEFVQGILLRPLTAGAILFGCLWPLRHAAWGWFGLISLSIASAALYYAIGYWLLEPEEKKTLRYLTDEIIVKKLNR